MAKSTKSQPLVFLPPRLLGYSIGLNTEHQALSCICVAAVAKLCAGTRPGGDPCPLFADVPPA